ncbi:MAG TPA: SRPBCC domain-containing protein [Nocardioidaceae bacterium]
MAELHLERVFDAPRELVWKAFTDPDQISAWFGPVGYSVPRETVDMDVRVGGHERFEMVADNPEYPPGGPVNATFTEVVPHELLVAEEHLEGEMAELFGSDKITMRLQLHEEEGGKTRLVLDQGPYKEEMSSDAREGWTSSFTKLDALLARAAA